MNISRQKIKDTDAFLPEIDDKRILSSDWERQF